MFKNYINKIYLIKRKSIRQESKWVCLTKERATETIKESQEDDLKGVKYIVEEILMR